MKIPIALPAWCQVCVVGLETDLKALFGPRVPSLNGWIHDYSEIAMEAAPWLGHRFSRFASHPQALGVSKGYTLKTYASICRRAGHWRASLQLDHSGGSCS